MEGELAEGRVTVERSGSGRAGSDPAIWSDLCTSDLAKTAIPNRKLDVPSDTIVAAIPLKHIGAQDELGVQAVYLVSEDASWNTKKNYRIDGGRL